MKHIALAASAGSGKTFTLSVRFIALVLSGAKIDDIVALTFTKKAVNEMKERITKVFLELESRPAELAFLEQILRLNAEQIIEKRNKNLKSFKEDELRIYTFDSFFSKILRLFATYEGLSVDAELIDYLDIKEQFLKSLSKTEAIKLVKTLKGLSMSVDNFLSWLEQLYLNYTGKKIVNKLEPVDIFAKFSSLKPFLLGANKKCDEWLASINDERTLLQSSLLDNSKASVAKAMQIPAFAAAYTELCECIARQYAFLESEQLEFCFTYLERFSAVAKRYHKDENILSFSDVAIYVHKILQNKDLKELFYFRLNSNLSHLLIDEFQDTSVIQYEIIKPLVEEIVSGIGINDELKSFFYVGDKKQSIYSFRGAKQEVFDLFHSNKNYNINYESLDTNYRSDKAIVDFVNANFSKLYNDYEYQKVASKNDGSVSKIISENINEDIFKVLAKLLKNGARLDDICILTRGNSEASEISAYLVEKGLNTKVNSTVALISKMSVRVLIEFARFCIFKEEIYGYFVECVMGRKCEPIRIDITKSSYEIYNQIISHLNLKKDEFVLEFLNIESERTILKSILEPTSAQTASSDSEGINIMTIHKSKGLQFKHLICVHLNKRAPHDNGLKIEYDFNNHSWYGFKKEKKADLLFRCEYDSEYARKIAIYESTKKIDEINTYYVAYTRAINSLCIIMQDGAGLSGIDYAVLPDEALDDGLLEFEYKKADADYKQAQEFSFSPVVEPQNVRAKEFNSDAIMLGMAFHYFCELSDFTPKTMNECLELAAAKYPQADYERLKELCCALIECAEFHELTNECALLKEYNFFYAGAIYRSDLLAINESEVKIIDYKSSFFNKSYEEQLKTYESFARRHFPEHKIRSFVIFYENERFCVKEIL